MMTESASMASVLVLLTLIAAAVAVTIVMLTKKKKSKCYRNGSNQSGSGNGGKENRCLATPCVDALSECLTKNLTSSDFDGAIGCFGLGKNPVKPPLCACNPAMSAAAGAVQEALAQKPPQYMKALENLQDVPCYDACANGTLDECKKCINCKCCARDPNIK